MKREHLEPLLIPGKRMRPRFPVKPTRREETEVERTRRRPKHIKRDRDMERDE